MRLRWTQRFVLAAFVADWAAGAVAACAIWSLRTQSPATYGHTWHREAVLALPAVWVFCLWCVHTYEVRYVGESWEECRRVLRAAVVLTALIAFASYAAHVVVARALVVVAIPVAAASSLAARFPLRLALHRLRARGRCEHRVVVVGHEDAALDLVARTRRQDHDGLHVVAACVLGAPSVWRWPSDVAVVPGMDRVTRVVEEHQADVVAVTACPEVAGAELQRLSWSLEPTDASLIVAPGLVEVAGPRMHIRPFSGLPLLHVERPKFTGGRLLLKAAMDRVVAAAALAVLAVPMLAIAAAVRLSSPGPAIFRQTRVGRGGKEFTLLKFRSMATDAESRLAELRLLNVHGDGPLFKIHRDPRVTRLGAWLRRYSLDELPQLLNVVVGHMSLVGPRPPLPHEVEQYGDGVRRRLLVKPGLTGLWQVSGRSNLSWEESIRLDLRYVENWSLTLDLLILCKTIAAVFRPTGAY